MSVTRVEVLVVGAGQAGIAASEHLRNAGVQHVVVERSRIAERWRTERWDSLVANGPAWHDRFPNLEFPTCAPDGFPTKDEIASYFELYAQRIDAPIQTGVDVRAVTKLEGRPGFSVATSAGVIEADYVIGATGPFQRPVTPDLVPSNAPVVQMHSNAYRNPEQLREGGVLVVGSGSSGSQIAEELAESGRATFLSVGSHNRPPRRYRGRDFVWWLGVLNKWDLEATPSSTHTTIAVSGVNGGRTMDFRRLAAQGATLVGSTESYANEVLRFADDLADNIVEGDNDYLSVLREADEYVSAHGIDLPEEPEAHILDPMPTCVTDPLRSLDLDTIGTIIWATGYAREYPWLANTKAVDEGGQPMHRRGISQEPGIYFLGLPWQTRRGSSFIWGVWYDAKYITDHIVKQRAYLAYQPV